MMIARLRGTVEDIGLDGVLIDVGGVGYPVQVSTRTRAALPGGGVPATVLVETHIREDQVLYFGFADRDERDWFRTLTTVQGVGGKVALNLLSVLAPDDLARSIAREDKAMLARADGVGPKLAARLVTELKDKARGWLPGGGGAALHAGVPRTGGRSEARADAVAALIGLQFRPADAERAVAEAAGKLGETAATDALIRAALAEIAR